MCLSIKQRKPVTMGMAIYHGDGYIPWGWLYTMGVATMGMATMGMATMGMATMGMATKVH